MANEGKPKMQALKRKPDVSVVSGKEMTLPDGTTIQRKGMTVREQSIIVNNKALTDYNRGVAYMAGRILVNGAPVTMDDVMDGFTTDELEAITETLFPELSDDKEKNG